MKPQGPIARRSEYVVERCEHAVAAMIVARCHYMRGAANTSVAAHCLRKRLDGRIVGAALWVPPTRNAARSVAGERWRGVLSLSRVAVDDAEPTNAESLLVGRSMRLVMRDPRWHTLLTYADSRQGHVGTIYRATGWAYLGSVDGAPAWIDPRNGRQVAARATRTRTADEMRRLGYERLNAVPKHKFVFQRPERFRVDTRPEQLGLLHETPEALADAVDAGEVATPLVTEETP